MSDTLSNFFADFEDEDRGTAMVTDPDGLVRFVIRDSEKHLAAMAADEAEDREREENQAALEEFHNALNS